MTPPNTGWMRVLGRASHNTGRTAELCKRLGALVPDRTVVEATACQRASVDADRHGHAHRGRAMTDFDRGGQLQQPQLYRPTHNLDQQGCLRVVQEQLLRHSDQQCQVDEQYAGFERLAPQQLTRGTDDFSRTAGGHGFLRTRQAMRPVDTTRWLGCFPAEAAGRNSSVAGSPTDRDSGRP